LTPRTAPLPAVLRGRPAACFPANYPCAVSRHRRDSPEPQEVSVYTSDLAPALPADEPMSVAEVRGRGVRGVAAVTLRGFGIRAVGLIVSIALARLLMPADFGVLAFGTTLITVGMFLTNGGLAAQLIRSPVAPPR